MSTSNIRTVCWVIATINNNSARHKLNFQIHDKEMDAIITNALRNQISDRTLSKLYTLLNRSLSDTFEGFFKRNPICYNFIQTIERGLPEVSTDLKNILFVQKKESKIKESIYEGEYKLISSFNDKQVLCLFDDLWFDCSSKEAKLLLKGQLNFVCPTTLVYLRVKKSLMDHDIKIASEKSQRVQKLLSDNRVKELYSRNASAERTAPSSKNRFKSPDPFPSAFNHKTSDIKSKILENDEYNSEKYTEIEGENKLIGNQPGKNTCCDAEKDDLKIKILIEKSLAEVEARLRNEFESKIQKNSEIYRNEEPLRHQQANKAKEDLLNFISNYSDMHQEIMKKAEVTFINLEKKYLDLFQLLPNILKPLDKKFKNFDSKLKQFDDPKNNIDPDAIIEKARKKAYDDLVSINNQSYEQFYNEYIKPLDEKFKNFDSKLKQFDIPKNNIDPEAIIEEARKRAHDDLVSINNQSYEQFYNEYIKPLSKKFKDFDSKLKQFDVPKNNIDSETIIEEARKRAHEDLVSIIDQNYKQLYNLYLEIKPTKESKISEKNIEILKVEINNLKDKISSIELRLEPTDEDEMQARLIEIERSLKEYIDKEKKSIKNEINEVKSNFEFPYSYFKKENDTKINDFKRDIEEIKYQINSIGKLSETNKSETEKLKTQSNDLNKRLGDLKLQADNFIENILKSNNIRKEEISELASSQELTDKKLKTIEEEIEKYKSEIFRQSAIRSNELQAAYQMHDQTVSLPSRQNINSQNYQESKIQRRPINTQAQTLPIKSQIYSKSGLPNIGNTCYMNSVIQILASTLEFTKSISSNHSSQLLRSLHSVISLMYANTSESALRQHISEFKDIISRECSMYVGRSPNDSKELFLIISDNIEDANPFTLVKRQAFICPINHRSYTEESSNFIIIPKNYQNNIRVFLNNIVGEKKDFYGQNQLMCDGCGELRNIILETVEVNWPNILTIYMPDYQGFNEIPDELQIGYKTYQIFGVICYYGFHYIAFTKDKNSEWEKYDDNRVSKNDPDWDKLYLSFYKKKEYH
ncbi:unnamed protein product [Blepharisma stoltei]|uniref:USP domain-containing protein n=1 Tax=Blepharisma stoltei TaxID=1481888 RepID=A0AAU9J0Z2_9CILI|nr:unnamed protein product [Blepharisma stoltei]